MQPLIGIPTRTQDDGDLTRYTGLATYTRALDLAGGAPVLIPLNLSEPTLRAVFDRLDGLLLQGGVDVHPREYGEEIAPYCGEIDPARDATELRVTRWALAKRLPILAICRGIQVLNIAAGGSLYQDIAAQLPGALPHPHVKGNPYDFHAHQIVIERSTHLARALGATQIEVNSLHHQALKQIAPGFHVTARAPDGIVEGIEADEARQFALAVQFHPEWMIDDDARMIGIFQEFVRAMEERMKAEG
ncbi:MAG: gamma-glutamyl-gamma-aminobutyrate hydrolase family protein [Chloroflexi bacterium]|nr:gamma-glutamyl-gamma-aminobutyrate hydrolase family protein [Chloroflexota bacterium]